MSNEALLIALLALPFAGSVAAGLLPANARNREAWLAGAVALAVQGLAWWVYPEMAHGQVLRLDRTLADDLRALEFAEHGF